MKLSEGKRLLALLLCGFILLAGCAAPAEDADNDVTTTSATATDGEVGDGEVGGADTTESADTTTNGSGGKKTTNKTSGKKTTAKTTAKTTKTATSASTAKTNGGQPAPTKTNGTTTATTSGASQAPVRFTPNANGSFTNLNSGVTFIDDPCASTNLSAKECLLYACGGAVFVDKTHPDVFGDEARFRRNDATSSSKWWFSYYLSGGISECAIVTYTNENDAGTLIKGFDVYVSADNSRWTKLDLSYNVKEDEHVGSGWYARTYRATGLSKSNKYLKVQFTAVEDGSEFYVPNIGRVRINDIYHMQEFDAYVSENRVQVTKQPTSATQVTTTKKTTTTTKVTTTTRTTTTTKKTTTTTKPTQIASNAKFTYPVKGKSYTGTATWQKTFYPPDSTRTKLQGSCYANGYWYVSFIKDDNPGSGVRIVKYDTSFRQVAMSEPLELDHANNLTYNTRTNQILVSHCQSNGRDRWNYYSFVDPNTLKITKTGSLPNPFFSMAYSPEKNFYGSARWGGETVDVWDGNLNHLRSFSVEQPKTLSQGVFCDENYIWFVRSETPQSPKPELRLYNWDTGKCEFVIPITGLGGEPESLHIIDGVLYILLDGGACVGLFTVQLTEK